MAACADVARFPCFHRPRRHNYRIARVGIAVKSRHGTGSIFNIASNFRGAMDWFRSHHGAPTDPKWRVIANKAKCRPGEVAAIFWALLDFASQQDDRGSIVGFDTETIAAAYDFEEVTIQAVIAVLEDKGVIKDGRLARWERRQPKREDDSTERVRAYRKRSETQRNAPEQSRVEENRTEISEAIASAAKPIRPLDLDKAYWETGKAYLEANGVPPQRSGGLLGRWRREYGRESVVAALAKAEAESPSEVVAFIEGCLRSSNGKRFGPATGIAAGFAAALQARKGQPDEDSGAPEPPDEPFLGSQRRPAAARRPG